MLAAFPAWALHGGTTVTSGDLPQTLRLGFGRNGTQKVCTGTRIGPRSVLTAAHCFATITWDAGFECVDLDATIRVRNSAGPDVSLRVEGVHIHPSVASAEPNSFLGIPIPSNDSQNFRERFDLAVVEFAQNLPARFPTATLSYAAVPNNLNVWMGGYGQTSIDPQSPYPQQPKKAAVRTTRTESHKFEFGVADEVFLLHGDSGGPVYRRDNLQVVGVNSMILPGRRERRIDGNREYSVTVGYRSLATPLTGMRPWVQQTLRSARPSCTP